MSGDGGSERDGWLVVVGEGWSKGRDAKETRHDEHKYARICVYIYICP